MQNRKAVNFNNTTSPVNLIVHGQGVFLFNTKEAAILTLANKDKSDGLQVSLSDTEFLVTRMANSDRYESQGKKGGLTNKSGAYYWFSLDSQNQLLQAGIGEPRVETACYTYQFDRSDKLWEANKSFLESLVSIDLPNTGTVTPLRLLKDAITNAVPLLLKGTNTLTMDDVAGTDYLASAALPSSAQTLYNCVAGEKFVLDTPDFPDFSKAIEYSIRTPGMWCNTRIQQKVNEFSKEPQPLETYLRITLGQNNGESPGIPYVMEIWPVGHYSPIHNHGGSNAIIRVLHGSIHVSLYPFLCDQANTIEPFATKDFNKGDITWISPTLNQVHMLNNLDTNTDTCITIQCYLYDTADTVHYDYFDYLGNNNAKNQYEPDSDMDFLEFKKTMRQEWDSRKIEVKRKNIWSCWA
jgi:predicted metal-dependent enzyme (double-stranded beta helix superfamily)